MVSDKQEVEWQFDAHDLSHVEAWLRQRGSGDSYQVLAGETLEITDTYFDTPAWHFFRAGYVLRARQIQGQPAEITLKSFGTRHAGLRSRREISERLFDVAGDPSSWLQQTSGAVKQRFRAILGQSQQPARPLFSTQTQRARFILRVGQSDLAEIALDRTVIIGDRRATSETLARVEVELLAGSAAEGVAGFVAQMRAACDLRPATRSKFELGLRAQGLRPIFTPDLGEPVGVAKVNRDGATAMLAFAVLREHFAQLLTLEPAVRLGEDPEAVHRIRVAIRRLRSALSLFRACLPKGAHRYAEDLKWVASLLGAVRDLDVLHEHLSAWQAGCAFPWADDLTPAYEWLSRLRAKAQAAIVRGLNSARYRRFASAFAQFLREGEQTTGALGHVPIRQALPRLIRKRHTKLRKLGDALEQDSPAEDYHALRIRCKRLRYALEVAALVFDADLRAYVVHCAALQELLGQMQDAYVAALQARQWALSARPALPSATTFALGALAQHYVQRIDALRAQFPEQYRQVKPRKRLHHAFTP